jgi:hypothetical protein
MAFNEEEMATAYSLAQFIRETYSSHNNSDGLISYDWDGDVVTIKVKCSLEKWAQAGDDYTEACDDQDWCPTCCRVNI